MSREIKFRLYSKLAKKYIDYIMIGFSKTGELRSYSTENGVGPVLEDSYIVEQYTGLKDKNGKEIYEGDIVRYSFINPNRTYTEPVSFGPIQDGEGYYHQEFLAWRTTYADDGEAHSSLLDLVEPNWTCEIIGNIHENPELLGGGE